MQQGGPNVPQAASKPQSNQVIPFRRATTGRKSLIPQIGPSALTAATQPFETQVTGVGYMSSIDLEVIVSGSSSSGAGSGFTEDAPWDALGSIVLHDVNGDLVNLSQGFELKLFADYGRYQQFPQQSSTDTVNVFQQSTSACGAGQGNFHFHLPIAVAINRRDLYGIVGNQDRAEVYLLRDDIAPLASIYTTAGNITTTGTMTINRIYRNFSVPGPVNANGARQAQEPDKFGILHFQTRSVNPTIPATGSTVDHPLQRLGGTIRVLIGVWRFAGSRASVEANAPTRLSLFFGDQIIYTTTWAEQKQEMWSRYGFDAPTGVLAFDTLSDFLGNESGGEIGNDYWWTHGLSQATLEMTYAAFTGAGSLVVLTDDLQVPDNIDIFS